MAFQKEGQFVKVTKPKEIKGKDGSVFKKSNVVISYTESNKRGTFMKELALDIFGKPEYVDKKARTIKDEYKKGDPVKVTFIVESRESDKGFFTTAKFFFIEHADRNSDDWGEGGSNDDWDRGNDAFDDTSNKKPNSVEEDDLPF